MEGSNGMSDAEMRLIMVNGQTIMLEGDFENINITNEFLNEMLLANNSKVDVSQANSVHVEENSCINCEKGTNDEISKLQISIRGENNELEMVQIGVEEAKALGLCLHEYKSNDVSNSLNCTSNGLLDEAMNESAGKIINRLEEDTDRVKLHSVPIVNVDCLNKDPNTVLYVNDATKATENAEFNSETYHFGVGPKVEKSIKTFQDDSADGLPAIGHLEGFQIPTSEDELLLPATVNAKMVDGSYQTITLVPQVVNGSVTYTVHFSHLPKEVLDGSMKSPNSIKDVERVSNNMDLISKELNGNEVSSVEEFLSSVQLVKNSEVKKVLQDDLNKLNNCKTMAADFTTSLNDDFLSKPSSVSCESAKTSEPINYAHQNQLAIDAKIDNLISENENVISRCKKVKYGKKVKSVNADASLESMIKMSKNNITKAKKVKFKGKGLKCLNDELDKKKQKYSLLKPSSDHITKLEISNRNAEKDKTVNSTQMPHMNLNGRLEYPNLKAIEETDSSLSYLKVKSPHSTKQPYFNVLPYPKTKGIPVPKQILPLNCDLQQAKNLISLQKFLETQKLQLKIQPIVSNGSKIVNIRPKPIGSEDIKIGMLGINSKQVPNKYKEKLSVNEMTKESKPQENESVNKSYQNNVDVKDVFLNDANLNNLKFLKPCSPKSTEDNNVKDGNSDCANKLNGIFIKNNPEYFNQKLKNGKIDEHPLGSSENPIQLVQTGHTFHSRQPLSEAQLQQIASILQKQKFDSPSIKKNSIFDPKTNTRIVYRVVYPEDVELKGSDKGSIETVNKKKRGRHKTKFGVGEDEVQKKPQIPRGPGRPKKALVSALEEDNLEEEIEDTVPKKKIPRTRSGRLSRPPRYMVKDYKRLHNADTSEKTCNSNYESVEVYPSFQNGEKVTLDERTENLTNLEIDSNLLPGLRPQQRSKRNFKPEYRCPTCQKIYLGHTRMMWHLNKFPDHCNVEKYKENYYRKRTETKVRRAARRLNMCDVTNKVKQVLNTMAKDELISFCGPRLADSLTTWDFLLLRVNLLKKSKKDEVDALIQELILLLEKLTKVAEDIFLPVFTKEAEKDGDCVEIDRMEVAIALGLPVGFYKVNNDNLNLLRYPLTNPNQESIENEKFGNDETTNVGSEKLIPLENKEELFHDKTDSWKEYKEKTTSKLEEDRSFWLENKEGDDSSWHQTEESIKTLSTKFEPNLSSKLLESLNDSIQNGKYEESETLINLDSNSKDVEQDTSSENLIESPDIALEKNDGGKLSGMVEEINHQCETEDKPSLWNENSTDKASEDLWTESAVETKSSSELWPNENSNLATENEKQDDTHLWKESSNLTVSEKVDDTNSEFLDSLLSVPSSNEFLAGNTAGNFLAENMPFEDKTEEIKSNDSVNVLVDKSKGKNKWRTDDGHEGNYMRVWNTGKSPPWPKEESLLTGSIQERMPGVRTAARLTSTPESNGNVSFNISNRRNSISDFSNINLESTNLDVVLPSAKTLIKDCLKTNEEKFELKGNSFLPDSENYKIKNWQNDSTKTDFTSTNVNSEDLMKMALESLTSQHDVMNVPPSGFDSAIGILNQNQEAANLNLFAAGETDALDFNLPLPDHLLRTNFASGNFQSPCEQGGENNFQNSGTSSFLSTTNNIFGPSCALPNSMKFDDQFETNFAVKKSKSLDDVMEFFETKTPFNGFEAGTENSTINSFPFASDPTQENGYSVSTNALDSPMKKKKAKVKKAMQKRIRKGTKKLKVKKAVDYPKGNSIESIINEALFESCSSANKPSSLQMNHSSPNENSAMASSSENYSLPIISESLDEVENLDFLNQD